MSDLFTPLYFLSNDSLPISNTTQNGHVTDFLLGIHPVFQTLIFTFINAATTALGASLIFCSFCSKFESRNSVNSKLSNLLGKLVYGKYWKTSGDYQNVSFTNDVLIPLSISFGAGVMLGASFFSLLLPAINHFGQDDSKFEMLLVVGLSFLVGVVAIMIFDGLVHKIQQIIEKKLKKTRGSQVNDSSVEENVEMDQIQSSDNVNQQDEIDLEHHKIENRHKSWVIFTAMTLHNIPEGIIVGVAFAAAANSASSGSTLFSAIALSFSIAIQNITEGISVTFPIFGSETNGSLSRRIWKSFALGAASGLTEPLGGLFGCLLVFISSTILPYALSCASGVMLVVVIEELVPLTMSKTSKSQILSKISILFFFIGFVAMMALDNGLA